MFESLVAALLLTPLLTAGLCWGTRRSGWPARLNVVGSLLILALGLTTALLILTEGGRALWGDFIWLDALSALLLAIASLVGAGAGLYSVGYLDQEVGSGAMPADQVGWYYLWFHLFLFTVLGVCSVNNLGIVWVFVEATTIVSALLVGFNQTEAALEAAWKYIIICTVGITCALFGLVLLYYSAGQVLGPTEAAFDWTALRAVADRLDPQLVKVAFVFVLIGYGTKAGLAPLHTWLPDATSQAPAPVGAVLCGVLHSAALYCIVRVVLIAAPSTGSGFTSGLLITFGLLSLAVAAPFILVQRDIKRLLAYSSVEHIGLITLALGLGGRLALYGGVLHLFNQAIVKGLLFLATGNLAQRYGSHQIGRIRGVLATMPLTGPVLVLAVLASTGVPPLSLFVSEFSIIGGAFSQGQWWLGGLVLLALALVFAGMLHHLAAMTLGAPPERLKRGERGWRGWILLGLPALATLLLGLVVPAPLSEAVAQVVAILGER